MKILCLCNHGNVRSACLAREIKDLNGACLNVTDEYKNTWIKHEAIAIGAHCCSSETITKLSEWADIVVDLSDDIQIMQNRLKELIKEKYRRFDVGLDRFGNPFHPEIRSLCQNWIKENIK